MAFKLNKAKVPSETIGSYDTYLRYNNSDFLGHLTAQISMFSTPSAGKAFKILWSEDPMEVCFDQSHSCLFLHDLVSAITQSGWSD